MPLMPDERDALNKLILQKMQNTSDIDQSMQNQNTSNLVSNLGEAAEGLFKARSMAVGGQGVDSEFYNKLRNQANQRTESEAEKTRQGLKALLFQKANLDEKAKAEQAAEQLDYQRGQDATKNLFESKKLEMLQDRPSSSANRYEFKLDDFGKPIRLDRTTGEITYVQQNNAPSAQGGQLASSKMETDVNQPPKPLPGENIDQYKARMAVWKSKNTAKEQPLNATQEMARTFANRTEEAENIFKNLEEKGFDRASYGTSIGSSLLPNSMQSENMKLQEQAERNFINALLRRESGAAIGKDEYANAEQQYFPRAGDTPAVKEQKRRNRQIVIQGLKEEGKLVPQARPDMQQVPQQQQRTVAKKQYSPSRNQTRVIYSDGTVEVLDGKQ